MSSKSQAWIKVLYDFKYTTREGQEITITKDENLMLIERTNSDWWHAQRVSENEPFYVPATYVEEIVKGNSPDNKNSSIVQKSGTTEQDDTVQTHESDNQDISVLKEEKKNHDSFRNVIRKLSSNMNSSSTKPVKVVKVTKKNSLSSHDMKTKSESSSETSTFAKCFGKDMKHTESRPQNRFQEELESALVNRSQRNIVFSSKMNDQKQMISEDSKHSSPEKPIPPAEKAVSQKKIEKLTQKLQENKTKVMNDLTKEFESRVQKCPQIKTIENRTGSEVVNQSILKKPSSTKPKLKLEIPKTIVENHKLTEHHHPENGSNIEEMLLKPSVSSSNAISAAISQMDDEAILKDNRKMWAIERLMSELMKSTENKSPILSKSNDETELNLVPEIKSDTAKDNEKVIFDFSVNPNVVIPKSMAKKSPKVLDEYNEANILNDNEEQKKGTAAYEKPSYSSVSIKSTRKKVTTNLNVKLKKADTELQLTPSLEKLANEIQFIPANKSVEKMKECSKSDTALNEFNRPKIIPNSFGSLDKNCEYAKKVAKPKRLQIFNRKLSFAFKHKSDKSEQQLKRKTRSLDDLNLVEEDVTNLSINNNNSRSNSNEKSKKSRKPLPLFKSTDSLKKNAEKPIPAKRKIFDVFESSGGMNKPAFTGSCENMRHKWPIDLERSTAVGFKTLLRTSDSGSEEFLQNKTFPHVDEIHKFNSNDDLFQEYDQVHSSDLSRNLSSELILSSMDSSESNTNANFEALGNADNFVQLPNGWKQEIDLKTRQVCYVNAYGDKWFSSNDAEGKIYFFEENSNKSSWALPAVKDKNVAEPNIVYNSIDNFDVLDLKTNKKINENRELMNDLKHNNWPQLFDGNMCILKEGFLNRTKITEHGKKLKKCWSSSYAVLTELFLLFFKDEKIFSAMKMGHLSTAKPDISVDLNGTSIESGEKFSSRKNVFLISTIFGLQVLIQSDNSIQSAEWHQEIQEAIKALPSGRDNERSIYNEE